jgi:hypothetical protein
MGLKELQAPTTDDWTATARYYIPATRCSKDRRTGVKQSKDRANHYIMFRPWRGLVHIWFVSLANAVCILHLRTSRTQAWLGLPAQKSFLPTLYTLTSDSNITSQVWSSRRRLSEAVLPNSHKLDHISRRRVQGLRVLPSQCGLFDSADLKSTYARD